MMTELGRVTEEVKTRCGSAEADEIVYGVDRSMGLKPGPKYVSADLTRYKMIEEGMFAYNPMRLNIGSIGYCSHKHAAGLVSPDYVVFKCDGNNLSSDFLYWYIQSEDWKTWTESAGVGSVRTRIYYRELAKMPITLPPIDIQNKIAHTLGVLDSKIQVNHNINQTLESIAQTIFKSWLVDFDPVKAKMEGREPEGIDAETAGLFPDKLVESELGMIPYGWEIESLSGIAKFLNGLALQKYPANEEEPAYPVLKIAELRGGFGDRTNRANKDVPGEYIVQDGDIIFSWSGSLLVKQWSLGEAALNQHLFKVTSVAYPKWFYYQWILHHLPQFQSIAAGKATTMGHIQRKHLDEAKVLVPPLELMRSVDTVLQPILAMQLENDLNSRTLGLLRETLLPKLISGEIQFPME